MGRNWTARHLSVRWLALGYCSSMMVNLLARKGCLSDGYLDRAYSLLIGQSICFEHFIILDAVQIIFNVLVYFSYIQPYYMVLVTSQP
jgi:hypothetical protein